MLTKESERKHERGKKNLCCERLFEKYDIALFKFQIKFEKLLIIDVQVL